MWTYLRQLPHHSFLTWVSIPLVDEAALEAYARFLDVRGRCCSIGDGTVSWSSGEQGCVKRHVKRHLGTQEVFMVSVCRWVELVPALLVVWPEMSQHWNL